MQAETFALERSTPSRRASGAARPGAGRAQRRRLPQTAPLRDTFGMGKGYAEGPALEERLAALERRADGGGGADAERAAVYASTEEDPEQHFVGWADEVDPDALFTAGLAWGIKVVRRTV